MPDFFESEWFVPEPDNWHLKNGAPKDIQENFDAWMKEREESLEEGIIID
jgi:hypothetical protein